MPEIVHDERHRYSYELRPDAQLDDALREIARRLEAEGLLAAGATSAPRFHPHLTLCRASVPREQAVAAGAEAATADVVFDEVGVFGGGRIVWVAASARDPLERVRAAVLDELDPATVDPLAWSRPWTPHVTLAYAVDAEHQAAARAAVQAALPLRGRWYDLQCWHLDVRPTELVSRAPID